MVPEDITAKNLEGSDMEEREILEAEAMASEEEPEEGDPLITASKEAWEDPSEEQVEGEEDAQAGVQVGLSPLGPMIQITGPDGKHAQKVITVEECFLLAGQLTGLGGFVMNMSMQAQMQEQARIQQMMQQGGPGEEKSPGGVYLKK